MATGGGYGGIGGAGTNGVGAKLKQLLANSSGGAGKAKNKK